MLLKVLLLFTLYFVNYSAQAEWIGIGRTNDGVGHFYANPRTIETIDTSIRMWTLADFEKAQRVSKKSVLFKSYLLRIEIDCIKNTSRYISFFVFPENMGNGEYIFSDDHQYGWEPTENSRILNLFAQYACKKSPRK